MRPGSRATRKLRGQILGDLNGMLKLIFHLDTRKLLGVWALGTQAMELVHIGQAVMGLGGTLDYFVEGVFNYPTLAECYKVAALDGFNKVRELASAGAVSPGSTAGAQPDEEATLLGAKGLGELTAVSAHGL